MHGRQIKLLIFCVRLSCRLKTRNTMMKTPIYRYTLMRFELLVNENPSKERERGKNQFQLRPTINEPFHLANQFKQGKCARMDVCGSQIVQNLRLIKDDVDHLVGRLTHHL